MRQTAARRETCFRVCFYGRCFQTEGGTADDTWAVADLCSRLALFWVGAEGAHCDVVVRVEARECAVEGLGSARLYHRRRSERTAQSTFRQAQCREEVARIMCQRFRRGYANYPEIAAARHADEAKRRRFETEIS